MLDTIIIAIAVFALIAWILLRITEDEQPSYLKQAQEYDDREGEKEATS